MITHLKPNQVFVFGSNTLGAHGGGAALFAKNFGAEDGVGEGMTGQTYAFPTLDEHYQKRPREALEASRDRLYRVVRDNPEKDFLLTPVGTGIAGYTAEEMKSLFKNPPKNLILPKEFL